MKKRGCGCLIPLILIVALGAAAVWLRVPESFRALRLLETAMEERNLAGSVTVSAEGMAFNGDFYWCEVRDDRYVCLSAEGVELYYHDEAVYFDNGRGYDLSSLLEHVNEWDENLLLFAGFRKEISDGQALYTLQLDETRLSLLERFTPEASAIAGVTLTLAEENGQLSALTVQNEGLLIQAELDHDSEKTIPTEILMRMTGEDLMDIQVLTPLFTACAELADQEVFGSEVKLNVDCGPLPISDTAQLYGTKDALWFSRSGQLSELSLSGMEDTAALFWGLGFTLCRDGVLVSSADGSQTYTLTVEAQTLNDLFLTILPELKGLGIDLDDGTMTVTLREERLTALSLTCSGEMPFLIATIPMEFSVELDRMEGPVTLPEGIQ